MNAINRQQLCAALNVSESTIRRLEHIGLPYTPVGARAKRYDLDECRRWLREHQPCPSGKTNAAATTLASWPAASVYTELCRKVQVRVTPSSLNQS
jgi:phage terminase Nu1 subunit (DNA packaging protein)